MESKKEWIVLLYYKFVAVANPRSEVDIQRALLSGLGIRGRIIVSHEGINGTLAGDRQAVDIYISYMNQHGLFGGIDFKESVAIELPFKKLIIKARDEIVTLGCPVDLNNRGIYIGPEELHGLYGRGEDFVIVDMRNNYEYNVGRFQNAVQPDTKIFKELPDKIRSLAQYKGRKVVTYCTGGIRCEKASALLVEAGFDNVYQLEGGIVKYLEQYPNGYFEGKNFVFDERMVTNTDTPSGQKVLASCEHCGQACDRYIDCDQPECHRLFICCLECEKEQVGLCPDSLLVSR